MHGWGWRSETGVGLRYSALKRQYRLVHGRDLLA